MGTTSAAGAHRTAPGAPGRGASSSTPSSGGRGHRLRHDAPPVQRITTAPVAQRVHQQQQIGRYLVSMGVRTACFVLAVVFASLSLMWLMWLCVALAVVLPYVAVLAANAGRETVRPTTTQVTAPLQPMLTSAPSRASEEPLVGHVSEGPPSGHGAEHAKAEHARADDATAPRSWESERLRPPSDAGSVRYDSVDPGRAA